MITVVASQLITMYGRKTKRKTCYSVSTVKSTLTSYVFLVLLCEVIQKSVVVCASSLALSLLKTVWLFFVGVIRACEKISRQGRNSQQAP